MLVGSFLRLLCWTAWVQLPHGQMAHMIIILGIKCADIECVYLSRTDNTSSVVFEGYLLARYVAKMLNPVSHLACKKVPVDHFSWGCVFWYKFLAQFVFLIYKCQWYSGAALILLCFGSFGTFDILFFPITTAFCPLFKAQSKLLVGFCWALSGIWRSNDGKINVSVDSLLFIANEHAIWFNSTIIQ